MNKNRGLIGFFGLDEWFDKLTEDEKQKMRKYSSMGIGGDPKHLEYGDISTSQTQQGFLGSIGYNAVSGKDYTFAEKILFKSLQSIDVNPIDRHFTYLSLIRMYYSQRNILPNAVDECVKYCIEDISHLEEFLKAWKKEEIRIGIPENQILFPLIPSLERLTIIYEKQGKIKEAIEICNIAIKHSLIDSTKGGFEARKAKLLITLDKMGQF